LTLLCPCFFAVSTITRIARAFQIGDKYSGDTLRRAAVQPGLVRVSLARQSAINGDGAILNLRFTVTGSASPIRISEARLNDAAGRDFVTSALRKQIVIGSMYQVYLLLIKR